MNVDIGFNWLVGVCCSVLLVVGLFIGTKLCKGSQQYLAVRDSSKMGGFIRLRNLSMCRVAALIFVSISFGIYSLMISYLPNSNDDDDGDDDIYDKYRTTLVTVTCFSEFSRVVGVTCEQSFEIFRLYNTFKDTAYAIRKSTVYGLLSLMSVTIFFTSCEWAIKILKLVRSPWLISYKLLFNTCIVLSQVMDFTVPMITSYLYSINLLKLVVKLRSSRLSQSLILSRRQEQLVQTIAKQTLLVWIMSMAVLISAIFHAFSFGINYKNTYINLALNCVWYILYSIHMVAALVCMWFTFIFAQDNYEKYCSKGHKLCLNWHEKRAVDCLQKDIMQQEKQMQLQQAVASAVELESQPNDYIRMAD